MAILKEKIDKKLQEKNLSRYKAAKLIGCAESTLNKMARGEKPFSEKVTKKLLPIIEVTEEEFNGWILADKYPENILKRAIKVKQEVKPDAGMLILTAKIDSYLQQKELSRTALSKVIAYSQGKLNEMIIGKEPMSPLVISKIAPALGVPEEEIMSWLVADKYSIDALRMSVE